MEENQAINSAPDMAMQPQQPVPVPPPAPAAMPMEMERPSTISNLIKTVDWLLVGFGILSTTALYFAIYYYKNKLILDKMTNSAMQLQLDSLQTDVTALKKEVTPSTPTAGF